MKYKMNAPLLDINGDIIKEALPMIEGEEQKYAPITLGSLCVNAMLSNDPKEVIIGTVKANRWNLAMKIHGQVDVELTAEEVTLIKDLIGKTHSTLVVGRVYDFLEAPTSAKKEA